MFIAALFIIARTWKQPKCPSTEEYMKKMCYVHKHTHTHTKQYYSATKKNAIMLSVGTWMDIKIIILSEVTQTEKDKYHVISLTCGL